ncbi:MAG: uracil-xanthine permease [Symploca sp. SIO1A3]|nr:uracil-xanthine permease [Symploca sp. SIO2C1]NER51452.1 uracil-xanthine permease [Symploca sp. SIO1A3]
MSNLEDQAIYKFQIQDLIFGIQILCVAFGALVIVPIIAGLDPNVALFTSGVGTLIFQIITGGKVPVFLASSFAFLAPMSLGISKYGLAQTLSGLLATGIIYLILSLLIFWGGAKIIHRILPPCVTSPVIMVIGLALAPTAVKMASEAGDNYSAAMAIAVSCTSLITTIVILVFAKGQFRLLPILGGLIAGYLIALLLGMVDFLPLTKAAWFSIPAFVTPKFHLPAVLFMLPVAIAPAIEHIGDILAIKSVTNQDYVREPGLHRTLLGDGIATSLAALLGGPPNTTYSEVTGAVAITGIKNAGIMTWAAISAIVLSFSGKLGAFLQTIPAPVMGGILVILFGTIVVVGIQGLINQGENLIQPRNLVIVSVILVFGVGGISFQAGEFAIEGIGLCSIVGICLNLLLPTGV